jgi:hypothetical protein
MKIIDTIKVEEYQICWLDDSYPQQPFYARFGILETVEQHTALNEGCLAGDPEWVEFDENVFYWISAYSGETIEQHTKEIGFCDFYYVKEDEND